jgi:uncharacterized protein (TIGR02722 family)
MIMKYLNIRTSLVFAFAALLLSACGTTAHRIDPDSNSSLITVNEINVKDWQIAAQKGINSLLASGVLDRNDGRKTIVMVSTVKNSTSQHINTRILTDKIRQAILRSGKALTTTAVGGNGADDQATRQVRKLENDDLFNQKTVQKHETAIAPDMSLSGEIVQQYTEEGRKRESYFVFHMALTDLKTGLAMWEENIEIVKQDEKPLIGW